MQEEWPRLLKALQGAIHAVEAKEPGGFRIHTGSAERIAGELARHAKGQDRDHAKQIEADAHKAKHQIDMTKSLPFLQNALTLAKTHAPDGAV